MKKPREVIQPRWGVYVLKRKAERMAFSVNAKDEKEALERAIKEYDVPESERWRISVQREP
jgi:1,2-phenylacetyl-CoA epoxidase PaaB subunit